MIIIIEPRNMKGEQLGDKKEEQGKKTKETRGRWQQGHQPTHMHENAIRKSATLFEWRHI